MNDLPKCVSTLLPVSLAQLAEGPVLPLHCPLSSHHDVGSHCVNQIFFNTTWKTTAS